MTKSINSQSAQYCPPNGNGKNLQDINAVRIDELDKRVEMQARAADQAIRLAANDLKARLDAMNEFRGSLKDQAALFIPRTEVDNKFESIGKDIKNLELSRASLDGKASQQSANFSLIISILSIVLSGLAILLRAFSK